MSLHSYHVSKVLAKDDPPFYSLIFAAMRKADTENLSKLKAAFPKQWEELNQRYNAPNGVIPEDGEVDHEHLKKQLEILYKGK